MAVGKATVSDFARMHECNQRAELSTTLEAFEKWDAALHEVLADTAHNGFITRPMGTTTPKPPISPALTLAAARESMRPRSSAPCGR